MSCNFTFFQLKNSASVLFPNVQKLPGQDVRYRCCWVPFKVKLSVSFSALMSVNVSTPHEETKDFLTVSGDSVREDAAGARPITRTSAECDRMGRGGGSK